jgi:Protein of unknown function (DUF3373)
MARVTGYIVKKSVMAILVFMMLALSMPALAADQADLMNKIDDLSKQLEQMKQQLQEMQKNDAAKEDRLSAVEEQSGEAAKSSAIQLSGDYRFRYDYLSGKVGDYFAFNPANPFSPTFVKGFTAKNSSLMTNRLGINLRVQATEDVSIKARLVMYKVWGHSTAGPVTGANAFFADKQSVFDGNVSHVPEDSVIRADTAYATWSNILGQPIWFSIGRRPSTGGVPTNLRQNTKSAGTAGTPGLLVDYAFDGLSLGYAPDIDALPGAFLKACYGKGFDSGFAQDVHGLRDVHMYGLQVVPYSTDNLLVELQWNRAMDLFGFPEVNVSPQFGDNTNLGDIDQLGGVVMGKLDDLGIGDLNLFVSGAGSFTHPNNNLVGGMAGMLYDAPAFGGKKESRTGAAVYVGGRYDIAKTWSKIGAEYNHGSKYWITFTPASDDMWTSKLGTRGNVYEVYLIQELNQKPITRFGKAYFRLGYQYYQFDYTGSSNWVGAPKKISDVNNPMNAQLFPPLKNAEDLYLTFNVEF